MDLKKKLIVGVVSTVILALVGWIANLGSKLTDEKKLTASLKIQLTKVKERVVTKIEIKRVPVFTPSGELALDGAGAPVFTDERITHTDNATERETTTTEETLAATETRETRSRDRGLFAAWSPFQRSRVGAVYTQRILGAVTLGVMADIDLTVGEPRLFVLAGVSF